VVHHLQQQIEDFRVRLLDLVEQHHRVRVLGDRVGQQAALIEADVARRRADQARHRVPLHVLGHVEADQLEAQDLGQLARDLGLADAGGAGEQEGADGLVAAAQAGPAILMEVDRLDRLVLAEDDHLAGCSRGCAGLLVVAVYGLWRDARDLGDHRLDVVLPTTFLALGGGCSCW
jgi:hypothetical protein